ncbi:MAG: tetratricopeptide repeat protein, partial [bacterium]|nr:tetratricopeptide repeat protein [bacterium]
MTRERGWMKGMRGCVVLVVLWGAGVWGAMTADQRIQQALAAARSGDARTAIPLLEQAERMHPFHPANVEVLYQLGELYIDAGRYEEAAATFEKLLKRYGKYADRIAIVDEAVVSMGRVLAGQKKYDEALEHVRKFKRERPKSEAQDYADYVIAYIFAEKGEHGEARKILENIAGNVRHRMRESAYFLLAEIAAKEGKFEQVEALMRRLLGGTQDVEARNAALFKLGEMYRNMGKTAKALDTYRRIKARGNDPASRNLNASILVEIGQTFEKLGHALEARVAFEGVAMLYGETAVATDAFHRAILADADYGDFERAERMYEKFRARYPGEAMAEDVRFYIAQRMMEGRRYEEAIKQLRAGLAEYPSGQWAEASFNALGVAYAGAKKFAEAERTLQEFAEKFPGSELVADSYFILAETYVEQGRYPAAIELYEKLVDEYGAAPIAGEAGVREQEVRMVYAEELVKTNRIDEAVECLRQVRASNLVEQAALLIGDAYTRGERYDEAERAYEEFVEKYPRSELKAQALFSLAEVRIRKEAYKEAEGALREILALNLARTNPLIPGAMLQIGFCRFYADDMGGMTNAMWEVVRGYPGSGEAGEALYWIGYAYRSMRAYEAGAE